MASIGLQISQAVETRLGLANVTLPSGVKTPPTGLTVVREQIAVVTPDQVRDGPLINMSIAGEVQVNRVNWKAPKTDRLMELLIYVYANANVVKAAEAIDPAYNWMVHALQSEPTMGGICHWIAEDGFESAYTSFPESEDVVAAREVKLHFDFHTRTDDPEVRNN